MARGKDRCGFYIGCICSAQRSSRMRHIEELVETSAILKLEHSRQIRINNGEMAAFIVAAKIVSTAVEASCLNINKHRWRDIVDGNKREWGFCILVRVLSCFNILSEIEIDWIARSLGDLSFRHPAMLIDSIKRGSFLSITARRSRSCRWVGSSFLAARNWLYFVAWSYIIPRGRPTFATCTWKLARDDGGLAQHRFAIVLVSRTKGTKKSRASRQNSHGVTRSPGSRRIGQLEV